MFQKEVAERIAAPHGNKNYGILSVLLQVYYDIEYLFTVHEHVFSPPPKVKSAVIRIKRKSILPENLDEKHFKNVVKTAFNQRRKTLRNALKPLLNEQNKTRVEKFLNLRAEQLSVTDFVNLSENLKN
jgi:16S rRNA (adenine1518-N6/adenine1519-N6)-dimethyltransferase